MNYPFNTGDLLCCGQCAANYLDANIRVRDSICCDEQNSAMLTTRLQVPWEDLRYMMGEIMYGGHIVEDWDRRLAGAYLQHLFQDSLLDGRDLLPTFSFRPAPASANHRQARRLAASRLLRIRLTS